VFAKACELGLEDIVSKRARRPASARRGDARARALATGATRASVAGERKPAPIEKRGPQGKHHSDDDDFILES